MFHGGDHYAGFSPVDLNLLSLLTSSAGPSEGDQSVHHAHPHQHAKKLQDRRPVGIQDPLMIAAAASAGPEVTRNHYFHDYFPHTLAYASCDDEVVPLAAPRQRPTMGSQQAPRRERLALEALKRREELLSGTSAAPTLPRGPSDAMPAVAPAIGLSRRRLSVSDPESAKLLRHASSPAFQSRAPPVATALTSSAHSTELPELVVQCQVRTRIPTPHGHVFLYLYKNNHDDKEHLAFVADQAQMDAHPGEAGPSNLPFLRSKSLDAEWREGETELERIVRGAYVGRLSAQTITPSTPSAPAASSSSNPEVEAEPPLVRIHSECFTGETIGSQRCDCGEQLDEAFRLITEVGRGVVVYLRQEGRGIGLLEKMRAYNLQDLGHDTVTANLLLGHGADMRTYGVAGAILRDLAVPEVRLLTNNPDKIEQIEKEGIAVVERVAMIPRSWTAPKPSGKRRARSTLSGARLLALAQEEMFASQTSLSSSSDDDGENDYEDEDDDSLSTDSDESHNLRRAGVGMIGASVTRSAELDKYLRTKVERMGHLLSLPPTPPSSRADSPLGRVRRQARQGRHEHPLASSFVSVVTDEGSVECGSGCEQCADGA